MTRGPMMETRWSNFTGTPADTNDVETISSAPPISSYRAMYQHAPPPAGSRNQGIPGVTPDHQIISPMHMPASTVFDAADPYGFSISDWSPRHGAIDVARVQIKPNASNAVSSSDSDIFKRSVNEKLDKYMVIRQRTFHGLIRSKSALRQLPLTDPRETMSEGSTPTWLHRSKTDLYIDKWRSKSNGKNRERSMSGSSVIELSGMTLGSLCESLPKSRLQKALSLPSSTSRRGDKTVPKPLVNKQVSNGSETRFPPLHPTSIKHTLPEPNSKTASLLRDRVFEPDVGAAHTPSSSPTKGVRLAIQKKSSTSDVVVLPSQRESNNKNAFGASNDVVQTSCGEGKGGKDELQEQAPKEGGDHSQSSPDSPRKSKDKWLKQKKQVAAIPLQIWEPSLEGVVPSNPKVVSPRHQTRAWPVSSLTQGILK